ncbi:MAG TPA: hypothetical protein VGC00_04290 [Thermoanaerobaculia bacterium]
MEPLLAAARAGELPALVVVHGDRALAAPLAERVLAALGELWGVAPRVHRFEASVADLVADLRTLSLFEPGKIVAVHDSGLISDRAAAAALLAAAREALPWSGDAEDLDGAARAAALRLLQVCRLHDIDPAAAAPEAVLSQLPAALFGDERGTAEEARRELAPLLAAAVAAGLRGAGEDELTLLGDLLRDGLPERHLLVLVESAIDAGHPLVAALAGRGALVDAGRLAMPKGERIAGLAALVAELERETGARLRADAARELAKRTLRAEDIRRGGASGAVDADSAARFAAEYRKLASLAAEGVVDLAMVVANVEDRGEENVFDILDALGAGRAGEALGKIGRRLAGADDRVLERLSLFGLLAGHARKLVAVAGAVAATGTRADESSFPRFRERLAQRLQGELEGVPANPLKGMHAFPLHRLYLAAARFPPERLAALPALTLETERRLKGDSGDPDAALAAFAIALAGEISSAPAGRAGSRARAAGGGRS